MNMLLLCGIAVFLGTFSGKIFQKLRIPQVVGYVIIGLILGRSVTGLLGETQLINLTLLVNFTLGVIGFLIGAELKSEVFKKYGSQIYAILISEGLFAFIAVAAIVTLLTHKLYLGLILGAIASATDPASTINVLWEYKSRGPLTTTLTSIVALDDGLALILYGLVSSFSKSMIVKEKFSFLHSIGMPLFELFECVVLGVISGFILLKLFLHMKKEKELSLALMLGGVAAMVGLSMYLKLDLILTTMVMGATVSNLSPRLSENLFKTIKEISTPLYILFFIVVGASLDVDVFLKTSVIVIILGYLFARSFGKIFGATLGAFFSRAKKSVVKYTGICLFTQGGVAMGLAMSMNNNLGYVGKEGKMIGAVIISVVAATTFVVQLLGPLLVKFGIIKADEAGRNVTLEDIIGMYKIGDFMQRDFAVIQENATLDKVIEIVKQRESYHFPVVNNQRELVGLISLGSLRNVFEEEQLNQIVLAEDVAEPADKVLYQEQPLKEAFDIFSKREIDYLPVIKDKESKKVVGIVEYRPLVEEVHRKLFDRQQSLEKDL